MDVHKPNKLSLMKKISLGVFFIFLFFVQMMWLLLFGTGITAISNPDKFIALLDSKFRELSYDNSVRVDPPVVESMQNLYDVKNHDLALSFDISKKELYGVMVMDGQSMTDTLNMIYLNLYDNMVIDAVKLNGKLLPLKGRITT